MKILVVGAGRMGFNLVQQLAGEDHELVVIDRDSERTERIRTRLDVMGITASGSGLRALREAGMQDVDLLIAVTNSDEVNIVSCLLAREMGIQRRIARVQSSDLMEDLNDADFSVLGVDEFINPEAVTVARLHKMVTTPGTTESAEFAAGAVVLRALRVPPQSALTTTSLQGLHGIFTEPFVITAVRRERELAVPTGEFRLAADDIAYVVTHANVIGRFLNAFSFDQERAARVMVAGGQAIGVALCARLEQEVKDVILLEPDAGLCAQAAERLSHTSVVHGSPLDRGLMLDLNTSGVDFFLGVSDSDEANLSSSLLARRLGAERVFMLTHDPDHVDLFESLPVDAVVSPLLLSVGAILRSLRAGRVLSLFKLAGDRGEALEIEVAEDSIAADKALREVAFPAGMCVAVVIGVDGAHVADGNTVVHAGDRVVVVALRDVWESAVGIFAGG